VPNPTQVPGDLFVPGFLFVGGIVGNNGCSPLLTDALISPTAAIQASKLKQQRIIAKDLQNYGSTAVAVRKALFKVLGTNPSVLSFRAGVVQAISAGSLTVDLLKNGSSILSAPITLNSPGGTGGTAFDTETGTVTGSVAAGDVLEANVAVSGLTGGGGLFCELALNEDPQ
jgi:hypothetical protein